MDTTKLTNKEKADLFATALNDDYFNYGDICFKWREYYVVIPSERDLPPQWLTEEQMAQGFDDLNDGEQLENEIKAMHEGKEVIVQDFADMMEITKENIKQLLANRLDY